MQCVAFLTWFEEMNLGLARLALKTHAFSACDNGVLQLSFIYYSSKNHDIATFLVVYALIFYRFGLNVDKYFQTIDI